MPVVQSRAARGRKAALILVAAAVFGAGCSRREGEEGTENPAADGESTQEDSGAPTPRIVDASRPVDAADAAPRRDLRAEEERAALTDAGRFCGEKDLPDCPLQLWMKRNATTTLRFGETSALAEVFEQIAAYAPLGHGLARETYPNWVSIARDGAAASRVGDIPAAKAACRGCHTQYRARYHADLRALPVPGLPPPPQP